MDTNLDPSNRLRPFGQGLFAAGIMLLVLRGLSLTTRLPGLPSFWYSNQALWIAIGIVMTASGWRILWGRPPSSIRRWRPDLPGQRFRTAILYVGQGCHLCEEAAEILRDYQQWLPPLEIIDIQQDAKLVEKFSTCVPVVEFDGKARFRGRIQETLLRRLIEGTAPVA